MRVVSSMLFLVAALAFAEQQPVRQPLTTTDAAALAEPTTLGHRILAASARYAEVMRPVTDTRALRLLDRQRILLTGTPTIDLLHACRYLSGPDFALARRYDAALYPLPPEAPSTFPVLTIRTNRGILIFDRSGGVALESPK